MNVLSNNLYQLEDYSNKLNQISRSMHSNRTTQCDKKVENNSSDYKVDIVDISKEGLESLIKNKLLDEPQGNDMLEYLYFKKIELKELPSNYEIQNYFKIPLQAQSITGEENNVFQFKSESQYKLFDEYLDNNEFYKNMAREESEYIKLQLINITQGVDGLNSKDGYRGTSIESLVLLESAVQSLECFGNDNIPTELKDGFDHLIKEFKYFNTKARENIMETMTPSYMIVEFQENEPLVRKYKDEIIIDQKNHYQTEQKYLESMFELMSNNNENVEYKIEVSNQLREHLVNYYKNERGEELENAFLKTNVLMDKIRKIWIA